MKILTLFEKLPEFMKDGIYSIETWDDGDVIMRFYTDTITKLPEDHPVESLNGYVPRPWELHYSDFEYRMLYAIKRNLQSIFGYVDQIADSDTEFVNYVFRERRNHEQ